MSTAIAMAFQFFVVATKAGMNSVEMSPEKFVECVRFLAQKDSCYQQDLSLTTEELLCKAWAEFVCDQNVYELDDILEGDKEV